MPHSAVIAPPAFAFAMILGLRVADTTSLYSDLYDAHLCVGCTSLTFDTIKRNTVRQIGIEKSTQDFSSRLDYGELYCGSVGDNFAAVAETEIAKFINAQAQIEDFGLRNVGQLSSASQEKSGCTYFERALRDPKRVRGERDNIEPDSEHLELLSVLALTSVSVISFALLAGIWLLRRWFRNWQLRNMILRGKTASNPPNS